MTIGRAKSAASETRSSVSWKVERTPNSGRNCFGRTSREAGHNRVPAPPHMIRGIIRLSAIVSNFTVTSIPRNKIANTVFDRNLGSQARIPDQFINIGESLQDVSRLHRKHDLVRSPSQFP